MARSKKKTAVLSPEDKLRQALVPVDEQPYQIPKNWCWTYILTGFDVTSSKRVHKKDWLSNGIPFYRTRELVKLSENGFVNNELFISETLYKECKKNYGVPSIGDLLISGVGTIGVPYIVNDEKPFYFKDGNVIWFCNKGIFLPKYIFYLYKSVFIFNQIHNMSAGTTVDTYTIKNAMTTIVPLPPLPEQQRIVDRIESLFAKLDEAKEKAQAVVDGFEGRKAAILHKAFTGELTAEWRKNNEAPERKQVKLGACLKPMETRKPIGEYFFYIDIDSIDNKRQIVRAPKKTLVKEAPSRASRAVHSGDVLFSMVRPYLKNIALIDESLQDCIASTGFYVCSPKSNLDSKYLYHLLCSKDAIDYLMQFMKGDNSPSIRKDDLLDMEMMLPSLPEQKQIKTILDGILEKEQQAKETAEQVIDQIDAIKKAILARAFRGELGTNDPNDESAVELLKKVL